MNVKVTEIHKTAENLSGKSVIKCLQVTQYTCLGIKYKTGNDST
jgi:hypothetical protein